MADNTKEKTIGFRGTKEYRKALSAAAAAKDVKVQGFLERAVALYVTQALNAVEKGRIVGIELLTLAPASAVPLEIGKDPRIPDQKAASNSKANVDLVLLQEAEARTRVAELERAASEVEGRVQTVEEEPRNAPPTRGGMRRGGGRDKGTSTGGSGD